MSTQHHKLVILGSGPAGYTPRSTPRAPTSTRSLITGLQQGGQLMTTTDVDNWPGDVEGVQGPELMERMQKHAERFKTEIVFDHINTANLERKAVPPDRRLRRPTPATRSSSPPAPRPSTSACPRKQAFMGKGVSGCATCDGFFYKGQDVAVIGGGNTAVEEALYLSNIAQPRHRGAPPRQVPRREDPAVDKLMAKVKEGKIAIELEPHARRGAGRQDRRHRRAHQVAPRTAATKELDAARRASSPSATSPTPTSSRASWR